MKVEIVTKSSCKYCKLAKEWLKSRGFFYIEKIMDDDVIRKEFYLKYGVNSVPQIFVDGERIGGLHEIKKSSLFLTKKGMILKFNETYKPFYYPWAVEITIRHEKTHWIEDEVDLTEDVRQWKSDKMSHIDREFITNILRLFTQSDVAVGQNYCDQFIPMFKNNEVRNMLLSIGCREGTHQRAYALLNDTLGLQAEEYHAFLEYKEMSDKIDFMMDSDVTTPRGLALALAKSVFNEGVSLMASFIMLLNFQRFGKMKGMGKVVEWSVRDETIHVEAVSSLLNAFLEENPELLDNAFEQTVYTMSRQVVELETKFIELAYKLGPIEGLEKNDVINFIYHMTDRRLLQIGFEPIFDAKKNPLDWVDWILNGVDHTNFFENRVTDYEIAGITGSWEDAYN